MSSMLDARKLKRSHRLFKDIESQHSASKDSSELSLPIANSLATLNKIVEPSPRQVYQFSTALDEDEQNTRIPKPTYLEMIQASLKKDMGLRNDMINHSQVNSAKVLGKRRSAVPLISEFKTHNLNFVRSDDKKER